MNTNGERIVVTGGTGLIGSTLIPALKEAGHSAKPLPRPYMPEHLSDATCIINLAGENLSAGRWSAGRKERILDSRVRTLRTLHDLVSSGKTGVRTLISASAVGYYGTVTSDRILTEADPPGGDFLADVCVKWEAEADRFRELGIRVVKVRIGVVFSSEGGILEKLRLPLRFGLAVPMGSGNQWVPWIHIDDLAAVFVHLAGRTDLSGTYNAVAPAHISNRELMVELARNGRAIRVPFGIPAFLLRMTLGEMASLSLEGTRISSQALEDTGFRFRHPEAGEALAQLLHHL